MTMVLYHIEIEFMNIDSFLVDVKLDLIPVVLDLKKIVLEE